LTERKQAEVDTINNTNIQALAHSRRRIVPAVAEAPHAGNPISTSVC
jgi:hypothetical protein